MSSTTKSVRDALPASLELEARLKLEQVESLTGWKRSKIYAEIAAGRFPEPERRGQRCSRWRAGTVLDNVNASAGGVR